MVRFRADQMHRVVFALLWTLVASSHRVAARKLHGFDPLSLDFNPPPLPSSSFTVPGQDSSDSDAAPSDWSPLHVRTSQGDLPGVRDLLEVGGLVDVTTDAGLTALHIASQLGFASIAELLLEAGADVDAVASDGRTPLFLASFNKHLDAAEVLLNNDADSNAKLPQGDTPLHVVGVRDGVEIAEMLLEAGAKIDAAGVLGFTPLHEAAAYGAERTTKLLLEKGADASAEDEAGRVPADIVCLCKTFVEGKLQPCLPGTCTSKTKGTVEGIFDEFSEPTLKKKSSEEDEGESDASLTLPDVGSNLGGGDDDEETVTDFDMIIEEEEPSEEEPSDAKTEAGDVPDSEDPSVSTKTATEGKDKKPKSSLSPKAKLKAKLDELKSKGKETGGR